MFIHVKELQYNAKPDKPDPLFAAKLQEPLGGQWGEISVFMSYMFQAWNTRGPAKYRDMLMDIGAEEIGHVEMLATMIARLLEGAPIKLVDQVVEQHPAVAAVLGGMNPQHAIVSGLGAVPKDSVGVPWNAGFVAASGNLLADFRFNVTAESQGRLQVCRLYNMTDDAGVKDMLSFLIARDTMHQNQWLAAIEELQKDGLEMTPVPSSFPQEEELQKVSYQYWNLSRGEESKAGRWANGPSPDGKGEFEYVAEFKPMGESILGPPTPPDPRMYGTGPEPMPPKAG